MQEKISDGNYHKAKQTNLQEHSTGRNKINFAPLFNCIRYHLIASYSLLVKDHIRENDNFFDMFSLKPGISYYLKMK